MRIALISPAGAMHRYSGSFGRSLHYAPLTLTTLAALIPQEAEADVMIYDETAERIPLDLEADLIAITAITGTSVRAYRFADYFRNKGIPVVMGGVHPTLMPYEAAQHADAIVTGLAEESWPKLLLDLKKGCLQECYSQDENVTLKGRPLPRRELLNPKKYITVNTVEVIRGCSLPCNFCAYPAAFGRKLYKRELHEVLSEIEALPGQYVVFPDVNLLADRQFAKEFFTGLSALNKKWFGLATSDLGEDPEMIELFRKSGCTGILIGFESVSQESQRYMRKGVNRVGGYEPLMKRLHDAGIAVNGCFAFGGDEEGKDVFERTVEMVDKLQIDLPRYSILTPFPGTPLYREMEQQGRIMERDWSMYDVEHCVFKPLHMTARELEEGIEWAWRQTYSMTSILRRLGHFKAHFPLAFLVNLGYRRYADKFHKFTREVMTDHSDIPEVER